MFFGIADLFRRTSIIRVGNSVSGTVTERRGSAEREKRPIGTMEEIEADLELDKLESLPMPTISAPDVVVSRKG